ncbi:MAG: hypothetical protein JNK74_13900 [Candidatus Hydrogenedentes bacterium]|nr:hypothetical protein [Candidatus Hydrogenedentota bacterium]
MGRPVIQFSLLDWATTPMTAIVWRELLTTLRQRRYGYLLITAAATELMVAFGALLSLAEHKSTPVVAIATVLTVQFSTLLLVVFLVVPALAAMSLAAERHQQTDDLLRTALFHPATVVAGKLLAVLAVFVFFHVALLPLGAFVYFFAGIELRSIYQSTLMLYGTALAHALIGISLSHVMESPSRTIVASYTCVALIYAVPALRYVWTGVPVPPANPVTLLMGIVSSDADWWDCLALARFQTTGVLLVVVASLVAGRLARLPVFKMAAARGKNRLTHGPIPDWGSPMYHRERRRARLNRPASALAAFFLCAAFAACFDRWSLVRMGWTVDSFDAGAALLYLLVPLIVVERCGREMDPETLRHLRMTIEGSDRVLNGLAAAMFVSLLPVIVGFMVGGGLPRMLPGQEAFTAVLARGADPDAVIYKVVLLAPRTIFVIVISLMCVRFREPSTTDFAVSLTAIYVMIAVGDVVLRFVMDSTGELAAMETLYTSLGVTGIVLLFSLVPLLFAQTRFDEVFDTGYVPYRPEGWEHKPE